jgi:hypothetical protein
MPLSNRDPFADNAQHLKTFPDHVLLDIARNDAAQKPYRLLAVEILQVRKSPKLTHPEIQHLVNELEIELDGIVFEHPAPGPGPLTSSVTTTTMFADGPIIENEPEESSDLPPEAAFIPTTTIDRLPKVPDVPPPPPSVPTEPKPPRTRKKKKDPVNAS